MSSPTSDNKESVRLQPYDEKDSSLRIVEERLKTAKDQDEIVLWTKVRGEILRQDKEVADDKHLRSNSSIQLKAKISLSVIAVGVGGGLIIANSILAGMFCLGAGLFWLAPEFVNTFFENNQDKLG